MMRRRGDGVCAHWDHPGGGDGNRDLLSGQVTAYSRFSPLAYLDLHRSGAVEVFGIYAETTGGYLYDGMLAEFLSHLPGKPPLAGIEVGPQFAGRCGQGEEGIVADCSEGHGGEDDRHFHHQIG